MKDQETGEVCPFLQQNLCPICYGRGHTAKFCTYNQDVMTLQMDCMDCGTHTVADDEELAPGTTRGMVDRMFKQETLVSTIADRNARASKYKALQTMYNEGTLLDQPSFIIDNSCCRYCMNHNINDPIWITHAVRDCPRIACIICNKCGQRGHTPKHCPDGKRQHMEHDVAAENMDEDEQYIIEFSD
jgi:hypothetical protein